MSIPFNAAANAYGAANALIDQARAGVSTGGGSAQKGGGAGGEFAAMLEAGLSGVRDAGKASDLATMNMVNGKADMVDVVTALSQTEIAIETMVSVRDRVITAYEEILRMPI